MMCRMSSTDYFAKMNNELKVRGQTNIGFLSYMCYVQLGVYTISWENIMVFFGKMYIEFLRMS